MLNDFPVLRVDQIWVTEHFRVDAIVTKKTKHSNHRMVIADLVVRNPPARPPR